MRNRLEVPQSPKSFHTSIKTRATFTNSFNRNRKTVPTVFCGPERYEVRYHYPLIIWLHSCHSNETELGELMLNLSMQNYVACAPRAPIASEANGHRFFWGHSRAAIAVAEESVFAAIEAAQSQFSVSRERIFIAGFGSGGSMAWRIALRYPSEFAGAVSICGKFPQLHAPLANFNSPYRVPTLWMYGAHSTECGVDHVCESLPIMHAARLKVDLHQYPCQDELYTDMLADANVWIMSHVTGQSPAFTNECDRTLAS